MSDPNEDVVTDDKKAMGEVDDYQGDVLIDDETGEILIWEQ